MTRDGHRGGRAAARVTRAGLTLVELIVVIAILGVTAGVAGLAFRAPRTPSVEDVRADRVAAARARALETGRPVQVAVDTAPGAPAATAYPDGSVLADPSLRVDRLTGKVEPHAP